LVGLLVGLLVGPLIGPLVVPSVPTMKLCGKLVTWKTGYVAIASRLVTVARFVVSKDK
jgi:hypothetical protein